MDRGIRVVSAVPVRRGQIYFASPDPVVGSEQGGRPPVLVLQNDAGNQHSPVTIVASITSTPAQAPRPTDVHITPDESGLPLPSRVLLNQIRTLDKRRLAGLVGQLPPARMEEVDQALRVSLGLVPL